MLQLPVATRPPHSRHTPAAAQRFHRPDASDNPADTGTRHAPGTAPPLRRAPTLQLPVATLPCHSRHSPAAEHRPHIVPTPRPPADTGPRLAAGHCPASPPVPNAPTPRRNAPAPFKAYPCRRTPAPHRSDASDNPADTGTRHAPGTASPHRRDPTLQLPVATLPLHSRHTPAAAQRPHTVPTLGPPRRHRDPPRAGHKKIRLCEPDLFICQ